MSAGKTLWYVKQLLPLNYATTYVEDGLVYVCKWRMWFGVCFDIKRGCIGQERSFTT